MCAKARHPWCTLHQFSINYQHNEPPLVGSASTSLIVYTYPWHVCTYTWLEMLGLTHDLTFLYICMTWHVGIYPWHDMLVYRHAMFIHMHDLTCLYICMTWRVYTYAWPDMFIHMHDLTRLYICMIWHVCMYLTLSKCVIAVYFNGEIKKPRDCSQTPWTSPTNRQLWRSYFKVVVIYTRSFDVITYRLKSFVLDILWIVPDKVNSR